MEIGEIVVSDFGEAYHVDEHVRDTGIPLRYAAPEAVLRSPGQYLGFAADVWALGSAIIEVRLGEETGGDPCHRRGYTKNLELLLGPLPEPYRSAWYNYMPEARKTELGEPVGFRSTREFNLLLEIRRHTYESRLECIVRRGMNFAEKMLPGENLRPNETAGATGFKLVRVSLQSEEADQLLDLLTKIFRYQPEDRLSAAEVFDHPWLAPYVEDLEADPIVYGGAKGEVLSGPGSPSDRVEETINARDEAEILGAPIPPEHSTGPARGNRFLELLAWLARAILPRMYNGSIYLGPFLIHG
ncbi:hypothetical protein GE09DRAFT_1227540 [Coniochaeta sp. 2T2.1]|nr:hypothetical protein GE09DRAFT_1227540 [Coniochaeta sp. 2T2.1]